MVFFQVGDNVFFLARVDAAAASEALWSSDGLSAENHVVFDQPILDFAVVGETLYFTSAAGLYRYIPGADNVALILEESSPIEFSASTDHVLLFEVGDETFSISNLATTPVVFETPSDRVVFSSTNQIVYLVSETRAVVDPERSWVNTETTIEFVLTDGIAAGSQVETTALVHQDQSLGVTPVSQLLSVQGFGNEMLVRILNDPFIDGLVQLQVYAIELVEESVDLLPGDANEDGVVGFDDFLKLSANFGKVDAVFADGDFNEDGVVDFADFLLLSANYGKADG